jgi:plastocyanin
MGYVERSAVSSAGAAIVILILSIGVVSVIYVNSTQGVMDQIKSQSQQVSEIQSQVQSLQAEVAHGGNVTLPVMNQTPTIRTIRETWYLSPSAHQDRFDPAFIIVNQGDNLSLTLIDNDSVAHDFVIFEPNAYNIVVNATVPGLVNDLTHQTFTAPAANNSPGVVVRGTPGNVSASYSFIAKNAGIFEFVCTYHVAVGMIGYLVVLPNLAYTSQSSTTTATTRVSTSQKVSVSILAGAATNVNGKGYGPDTITVYLGVNNTVSWTNHDNSPHTVTQDGGGFDSGNLPPGGTYVHTFTQAGVYNYHCVYHYWMTGTVIVKA